MDSWVQSKKELVEFESQILLENLNKDETVFLNNLMKLCLLYDVPFTYLVPEPQMLPSESIRFFQVDSKWIYSLLDGACSVGRNTKYDISHDEQMIKIAYRRAIKGSAQVRLDFCPKRNAEKKATCNYDIYTGFLLNSCIVSDYNGLEITGFGIDKNSNEEIKLQILRLEQLSKQVMLGIFAGTLHKLSIAQPKEAIHLGTVGLALRNTKNGHQLYQKGESQYDLPIKPSGERVIAIGEAVKQIKERLKQKQGEPVEAFTSAEMALELIQNAFTVYFERGKEEIQVADRVSKQ